jgi:hypothetical protein
MPQRLHHVRGQPAALVQAQQRIGDLIRRQHHVVLEPDDAQPDRRGADQDMVDRLALQRTGGFRVAAAQQVNIPISRRHDNGSDQQRPDQTDQPQRLRHGAEQEAVREQIDQRAEAVTQRLDQHHTGAGEGKGVGRAIARVSQDAPNHRRRGGRGRR